MSLSEQTSSNLFIDIYVCIYIYIYRYRYIYLIRKQTFGTCDLEKIELKYFVTPKNTLPSSTTLYSISGFIQKKKRVIIITMLKTPKVLFLYG